MMHNHPIRIEIPTTKRVNDPSLSSLISYWPQNGNLYYIRDVCALSGTEYKAYVNIVGRNG